MIELGKTYKDGLGRDVRIICVDRKDVSYRIIGLFMGKESEITSFYSKDGKSSVCRSEYDLILPEDFRTFAIDEPVMVRYSDDEPWERENFAGVDEDGNATAWYWGTKWASKGKREAWSQCRRPTKEELES